VICSRHTFDYVEKVPFKGDPDNTVSICGEFIIFDAKSPKGEDLSYTTKEGAFNPSPSSISSTNRSRQKLIENSRLKRGCLR
jgi:hypothetical protein